MNEDVVFKGSRAGLELVLSETAEFSGIMKQLKEKLDSAIHFFGKGARVNIAASRITKEQEIQLCGMLRYYGLTLNLVDLSVASTPETEQEQEQEQVADSLAEECTVVDKTVRGGQEIMCRGSIVIHGNVNPGAKIIAGGNIEVRGTCRGLVHAGAFGDVRAVVVAERMLATQIRIGDLIARAPDDSQEIVERGMYMECACVRDGNIVIEPVNKQEVS